MRLRSARHVLAAGGRTVLGSRQLNHLVRLEPVLELVTAAGPGGTLLDVGSGSLGIGPLLPSSWRVTSLDADFEDYGAASPERQTAASRVLGDVRVLPFADHSFDVVVAVDLLEHVPPADRERAIGEICRVAGARAVIACPADEEALTADRGLAARLQARGHSVPGWLDEHLEHGFPIRDQIMATAERFGSARLVGNENIDAHVRLVLAELSVVPAVLTRLACCALTYLLRTGRGGARRRAARVLYRIRGGDRPPTYRAVVVVDIGGAEVGHFDGHSRE